MATDFGKRIRSARKHAKLTQKGLAALVGMSQPSLSEAETTAHSSQFTAQIASACGVDGNWLATGEGKMIPAITTANVKFSLGDDADADPRVALYGVPLITWSQAATWLTVPDPYEGLVDVEWLPCPAKHGPRTYCLSVSGDSMLNPGGLPSYGHGDVIFVDPDRGAKPGDRVIVTMDDQPEATFKQLVSEDGRRLLKALNPEWKPRYTEIGEHADITGVIIGKWVPE